MTILGVRIPSGRGYEIELFHCFDTPLSDPQALMDLVRVKRWQCAGLCVSNTFAGAALKALDYAYERGETLVCAEIDNRIIKLYSSLLYAYDPRQAEEIKDNALGLSITTVTIGAIKLIVEEAIGVLINHGVFASVEGLQKEVPAVIKQLEQFSQKAAVVWQDYYIQINRPHLTEAMIMVARRRETDKLQRLCQASGLNHAYIIEFLFRRLMAEREELSGLFEHNPMVCPFLLAAEKKDWWQGLLMATRGQREAPPEDNIAQRSGYEWTLRWLKENPLLPPL